MVLAGMGALTNLAEAVATSVGAGMLLGGFIAGSVGTVRGGERAKVDQAVLFGGYFGGTVVVGLAVIDLLVRYGG